MKINIMLGFVLWMLFCFVTKDVLMGAINRGLPAKEAGLMAGILIGDKTGFGKVFYTSLIDSGLVHLVVVSGSNVMLLIGGLIENMAPFFNRKRSIIFGLVVGWWYVYIVGWEIPVLRAMLLLSILYLAQLMGRRYSLWRALVLSILIMATGDIRVLISVSFWLSILAFVAILIFKVNDFMKTVWVSIWITPVLAMVFGKISIISPLTNWLVIGVVEWLTVVGAMGMFWLAIPMLKYLEKIVDWGSRFGSMEIKFNWLMLVGYYLVLLYFLIKNKNKINIGN